MVHSGSASPMKTSPTASPHLTAPPLQVAPPLEPPHRVPSGEDPPRTPSQHFSADRTPCSDFSQPFTLSPLDTESPFVTPAAALGRNSRPNPAQDSVNGRTSGRKRTPKACDCCGPNSQGHGASGKGKGRARSRGRGADNDLGDTPKRKVKPQLTHSIKSLDLNMQKEEEAGDGDNTLEKNPTPVAADTEPHGPAPVPVTSPQDGPIRNCAAPEAAAMQKHEDTLMKGGEGGKVGGVTSDAEMRLLGKPARRTYLFTGRGRGGRGAMTGAAYTSLIKAELNRQSESSDVTGSKANTSAPSVVVEENKEAQMQQGAQSHSSKGSFGNGDTVNLSDSDSEGEDKGVRVNGLLSTSPQSQTLSSDQAHDTGSVALTLSNGDLTAPTDHVHKATPMEVDASQCPIAVQSKGSLRDHMMYCQTGTWEEGEDGDAGMDEKTLTGENLEQLTDMVHDYLESFYLKYGSFIPLSETDILEHLKKNGDSDFKKWGLDIKREMTRYKSGLASAPIAGFMLMYNKHSLSLDDLGTLEDQNWLNDQIINMYGELIMEATQHKVHFFNSFFYKQLVAKGYDGVKRWTKKVDLFSKWLLLIPIHLEIHWSLVTVTMATKTISYYDSQGIVFRHTTDNILKYLQSEAREKEQASFQKGWKITIIKGIPQQKNDSDCGVFVLEYCRRLSVKQPLQFSQEDMPHIRKRIYKELCDCRLND